MLEIGSIVVTFSEFQDMDTITKNERFKNMVAESKAMSHMLDTIERMMLAQAS
ncbi:hypothetical protein PITCH_A1420002 [uncultured Desulfobacterium sp.]|uniref:Uncharacterized protein n=1 Tax=uncultured Desulfobacterium sp. TaxID=201089 RepID=A0A445MSV1_9BACT|nr:hypothetical protein PITCH_A1420002 [uncultured Desulfobacterium sp.]